MLQFDPNWRFNSPGTVDPEVVSDILQQVINRIAGDCSRKHILETFKRRFAQSIGTTTGTSSSESWAESDLERLMSQSGNENAALFAEALHGGMADIEAMNVNAAIPPWDYVNRFLTPSGFAISPPHLVTTAQFKPIAVPAHVPSLDAQANEKIQRSLHDSEHLLASGKSRAAVQEILWLLETISTAFRGVETANGSVTGKYFSKIIADLRNLNRGKTLDRVSAWLDNIYGYLSAPDGGGIRHGAALSNDEMTASEARLFCDLSRSYITYLLHEHTRLVGESF
ncbi:hypothetical protein BW687_001510 [Pseudomonas graminis]|uniref:hypothetical protein n=1 Tax=Pseudomonas graminis TaxID=158627 RepID=UPI00234B96D5|nr:hypothetical protein [Pseudomonas graminis]MDC6378858.1 hypothetical protein [Pseudomonas graminis]